MGSRIDIPITLAKCVLHGLSLCRDKTSLIIDYLSCEEVNHRDSIAIRCPKHFLWLSLLPLFGMTRYHCPFCSPRYQIHIQRSDGVMICGQCGDPLTKLPLIKATQVFAFIIATAFIAPLIVMLFAFVHDSYRSQPKRPLLSKAVILKSIDVLLVER